VGKMAWLNFLDSIEFLKKNNVKVLEYKIIYNKEKLEELDDFPYVLKLSSNLLHKTEEKAVITDLYSKESLISAYAHLLSILKKHKLEGKIILQKQVKGLELIVGINKDEQFGKIILFGQGGIYTEVLDDTAIRILPIGKKEIEEMIFSTRISKLFFARGVIYDTKKIIDLIENISRISSKVQELDLNPVIFTKEGVYIVDARVKLED
jgi:hypothetical protein